MASAATDVIDDRNHLSKSQQESHAIAKTTARCALFWPHNPTIGTWLAARKSNCTIYSTDCWAVQAKIRRNRKYKYGGDPKIERALMTSYKDLHSNFSSILMHFRDIAAFVLWHATFPTPPLYSPQISQCCPGSRWMTFRLRREKMLG